MMAANAALASSSFLPLMEPDMSMTKTMFRGRGPVDVRSASGLKICTNQLPSGSERSNPSSGRGPGS